MPIPISPSCIWPAASLRGELLAYWDRLLVWTKLGYSLGTRIPNTPALSPQEELVIQKSFFDHMWNILLSELCKAIGYNELNNIPRMPDLSHLLNEDADIEREKTYNLKKSS